MATLLGIKNCDTVKKARQWLDNKSIAYQFHDFRIDGLSADQVNTWLNTIDWQVLVNKRSTTWRQLPDDVKQNLDEHNVVQVLLDNPTLIKRPILEYKDATYTGFKPTDYETIFANEATQ